jgi:hypothetical protein
MTAAQLAAKQKRRAARLQRELAQTARGIAISARRLSRELMTQGIYALDVDRTASGKPKWRRTGHLRRSERYEIRSPVEVAIVNDAAYAEPRHEAGKPGRRNINPLRRTHWRDEMAAVMRPIALELWHEAQLDALRES